MSVFVEYINSFLNTAGGTLVIGVEDNPHVVRSFIDDTRGKNTLGVADKKEVRMTRNFGANQENWSPVNLGGFLQTPSRFQ